MMANNITEKGAKMAAIRADKRAAALRDNLKRRKLADVGNRPEPPSGPQKGEDNDAQS